MVLSGGNCVKFGLAAGQRTHNCAAQRRQAFVGKLSRIPLLLWGRRSAGARGARMPRLTMRRIASRISVMTGEGALAVFSRAKELERQGHSIIHLELGEPDFHAAAPVVDAARDALAAGRDRYVSTRGIAPLRQAIAGYLARTRRLTVRPEQVLVAPGCKMALALAMMALIEPCDEVLYPEPGFPIHPSFTRGLGAVPVAFRLLETNRFQPDLYEISSKITPKTR